LICSRRGLDASLNLRLVVLAHLDLVAKLLQTHGKLGAINAGHVSLRLEQAALLKSTRLAVLTLSQVEDHRMRVKLRSGVAVHRPRGIVLKRGSDEFPGRFGRMNIADARLRVPLEFLKGNANTFPVCLSHTDIATYKSCE